MPKKDKYELCSKFRTAFFEERQNFSVQYETQYKENDPSQLENENEKKTVNIVAFLEVKAVLPCPQSDAFPNVFNLTNPINSRTIELINKFCTKERRPKL